MKVHIMRWAPQDWRTSRVRARSAMTGDHMLRLVYFEALNALHEAGGELPADPEALADELMLPAEEIARCLPILAAIAQRGGRGGLLVEDGLVRNPRVVEDLQAEASYRADQATFGKVSAAARRAKGGSAQPQGRPNRRSKVPSGSPEPAPEGTLRVPSTSPEPEPEPVPNPPYPYPSPTPSPENNGTPPGPPAPRVGTGGGDVHQVGDVLRDGREVLEVDADGRPTVVSRGEGTAPTLTREASQAVNRLVAYASVALGYRFDRAGRRRLRDRLLGGETEAQIRAGYEAQVATLEAAEAFSPVPGETDDDTDLEQALRLAHRPVADVPRFFDVPPAVQAVVRGDP